MYRLFLFFLFSFFISFHVVAQSSLDFTASGCDSSVKTLCPKKTTNTPPPASGSNNQPNQQSSQGASTECDANEAMNCCSDPTTCLGGGALSTFQDINSIVTNVGPGLAMAMQGMGKDMYKLCQTMQKLAAGGAGLTLAARKKCTSKINSCHSRCNNKKQEQCQQYEKAKTTCKNEIRDCAKDPFARATCSQKLHNEFKTKAEQVHHQINEIKNIKNTCTAQEARGKELTDNMEELVASALSAELCKQQTKIPQKQCLKNGGKWIDMKCHLPDDDEGEGEGEKVAEEEEEEKEEEKVALRENDGNHITQFTKIGAPNTETPPKNSNKPPPSPKPDGDPDRGGGGNDDNTIVDTLDFPPPSARTTFDPDSDGSTGTNQGSRSGRGLSGGLSGLGGIGGTGFSPYKRNKNNDEDEDDDALSMGGGGFGGYGGGGGFGDSSNAYASLGLSKKKLDELKKKKGAKRVTASEAKGTHQNIFERISKRFQSLCQSKLDCR